MGLALHDPTASLAHLAEHRHLPPVPLRDGKLDILHVRRAKYNAWRLRYEDSTRQNPIYYKPRPLRPHQASALASVYRAPADDRDDCVQYSSRIGRTRRSFTTDVDEGVALAHSGVPLPSDGDRKRRPPSLEREEAFRDVRTTKKRPSAAAAAAREAVVDDDVAELYRMGLLYDDEHERGSQFNLDTIVHDEPAYSLNIRQEKRWRKRKVASDDGVDDFVALSLHSSFALLSNDEAVARYLIAPAEGELSVHDTLSDEQASTAPVLLETREALSAPADESAACAFPSPVSLPSGPEFDHDDATAKLPLLDNDDNDSNNNDAPLPDLVPDGSPDGGDDPDPVADWAWAMPYEVDYFYEHGDPDFVEVGSICYEEDEDEMNDDNDDDNGYHADGWVLLD